MDIKSKFKYLKWYKNCTCVDKNKKMEKPNNKLQKWYKVIGSLCSSISTKPILNADFLRYVLKIQIVSRGPIRTAFFKSYISLLKLIA